LKKTFEHSFKTKKHINLYLIRRINVIMYVNKSRFFCSPNTKNMWPPYCVLIYIIQYILNISFRLRAQDRNENTNLCAVILKSIESGYKNIKPCQNNKLRNKRRLKLNINQINENDKRILNILYSLRFNKQLTYKNVT